VTPPQAAESGTFDLAAFVTHRRIPVAQIASSLILNTRETLGAEVLRYVLWHLFPQRARKTSRAL